MSRRTSQPALPARERGRVFQMWDYSATHRTLLLRRPADDRDDDNFDLIFAGVESVNLASVMTLVEIETEIVRTGRRPLYRVALVTKEPGHFFVFAERFETSRNEKSIFEGLADKSSTAARDEQRFELEVEAALRTSNTLSASLEPLDRGQRPDFIVGGNQPVWVDAIWTNETNASRQIRSTTIKLAPRWASLPSGRSTPLILVVGGLQARVVATEIAGHFKTAMGNDYIEALAWDSTRGPDELRNLIARVRRSQSKID